MLFEVDDLSEASPATVSWCGMVYMEPEWIGSKIMFMKWFNNVPSSLKAHGKGNILIDLTNYLIPQIETKMFSSDHFMYCLPNISKHWLFTSYMRFLESLLMGNLSWEDVFKHEETEKDKEEARLALDELQGIDTSKKRED